jgi:RNA polymerase sigma-70 factor (ECF subfamily)
MPNLPPISDPLAETFARELGALEPQVKGYLARVLKSHADAEDAWQKTLLAAVKAREQLQDQTKLRGWVYAIAHRAALAILRENKRHENEELDDAATAIQQDPKTWWRRTSNKATLRDLIDALPLSLKTLMVLRLDRELGWDEIAEALGTTDQGTPMTAANARQMFSRVKDQLTKAFRDQGALP